LHPGTPYDLVFKRSSQGEIIVSKKPNISNVVWRKAQAAVLGSLKL